MSSASAIEVAPVSAAQLAASSQADPAHAGMRQAGKPSIEAA